MTSIDHLLFFTFAIAYPIYVTLGYRRIKPDLVANKPGVRWRDYREGSVGLSLLGMGGLATWIYQGRPLSDLGLGLPSAWPAWLGMAIIALLSILLVIQLRKLKADQEQRKTAAEQLSNGPAGEYLPRNRKDLKWFVVLSFAAGINEEILFRGFLLWYFSNFSLPVAIVLSSVLFGLGHAYQGWQGIMRTGFAGLIVALAYVLSGSLWVVIFLHIAGDLYSGALGWIAFDEECQPTAD